MSSQNTENAQQASQGLRILVAEDSPVNRMLAVKQLEALGHACDAVADGTEVIAATQRSGYDVILMDCHMPQMNGYEATWQIRDAERRNLQEGSPRTYIIAMTANSEADTKARCKQAGMDDYIDKPVQLPELEAALRRARTDRSAQMALDAVIDPVVIAGLRQLRGSGEPDPLPQFIDMFLSEAAGQLDTMERSISSTDPEALSNAINAATALKSGAVNLGARNLAALADEYVQAAKTGYLSLSMPLVHKSRAELERAQKALEKIRTIVADNA